MRRFLAVPGSSLHCPAACPPSDGRFYTRVVPAAVLAALAFFALRPRKGWLRRKRPPASIEDASSSDKDTMHDTPLKGSHGASASMHHGGSSPPSTMPGAAASAASGSELGPGTLSPRSRVADGVLLQLSSSGSGAGSTSAAAASPTHAALTQTDSQTSRWERANKGLPGSATASWGCRFDCLLHC